MVAWCHRTASVPGIAHSKHRQRAEFYVRRAYFATNDSQMRKLWQRHTVGQHRTAHGECIARMQPAASSLATRRCFPSPRLVAKVAKPTMSEPDIA